RPFIRLTSAPSTPTNDPTFKAITGSGYLDFITNAPTCVISSNIWIADASAHRRSNGTVDLVFSVQGGSNSVLYDVFATWDLKSSLTNSPWAWMGQCEHCKYFSISNLPASGAYLILGQPDDADLDGISDAYETLISHSDPSNPDQDGDGL